MLQQMVSFFTSWFINPNGWGIGLAIIFGAVWLASYWPPLFQKHRWHWSVLIFIAVLVISAILTLIAVVFIQVPLQDLSFQGLNSLWGREIVMSWLLLTGIPAMLLSGLVQEGAKLVPIVAYWWRQDRNIDPKLGLAIGAVAGAGFGAFEAQWVHNSIFAAGWSWDMVQTGGIMTLAPFWERFFIVAFNTSVSALAGYGLARGWGWQFYLLAALLHAFINYSSIFFQTGVMDAVRMEIFVASCALLVTYVAL